MNWPRTNWWTRGHDGSLPRVHPTGLQWRDRIRLDDGRMGTICSAVTRLDQFAYVIPDDESQVQTVRILELERL